MGGKRACLASKENGRQTVPMGAWLLWSPVSPSVQVTQRPMDIHPRRKTGRKCGFPDTDEDHEAREV